MTQSFEQKASAGAFQLLMVGCNIGLYFASFTGRLKLSMRYSVVERISTGAAQVAQGHGNLSANAPRSLGGGRLMKVGLLTCGSSTRD